MDFMEFSDKTVEDALTKACIELGTTSDKIEYEVLEKESKGIFRIWQQAGQNTCQKKRRNCTGRFQYSAASKTGGSTCRTGVM